MADEAAHKVWDLATPPILTLQCAFEGPAFAIFDTLESTDGLQKSKGRLESVLILQLHSTFRDQGLSLRMLCYLKCLTERVT